MVTLGRAALEKVTSGITTTEEVYRVVETDTDFASACPNAPPHGERLRHVPSCGYSASATCPVQPDGLSRVEILPLLPAGPPEARGASQLYLIHWKHLPADGGGAGCGQGTYLPAVGDTPYLHPGFTPGMSPLAEMSRLGKNVP